MHKNEVVSICLLAYFISESC